MKTYYLTFLLLFFYAVATAQTDSVYHGPSQMDSVYGGPSQVNSLQTVKKAGPVTSMVLKSTDGGKTWQDLSKGLPDNWEAIDLFCNQNGLYVSTGNRIYHNKPNSLTPQWANEISPDNHSNIAPGKAGIYAFNWDGQFLQKRNGTTVWSPQFKDFPDKEIRSVFETATGTLFICTNSRIYKSTNDGKTWKEVHRGGWTIKLAESNGVLMATSGDGIIRSVDDGETWKIVLNEGGVGIDITPIKGGFAAITFNALANARTVKATYDGGKTWNSIDAGLPPHLNTASIIQVGDNFLCGHPDGIFLSSDKGKTWKLVVASPVDKVFKLFVSGNVIYAIARFEGC
jgi:photosystem II stability/assembly factor-like uncharacterized protein